MTSSFTRAKYSWNLKHNKTDQLRRGATTGPSKQDICPLQITKHFLHLRRHAHKQDAVFPP